MKKGAFVIFIFIFIFTFYSVSLCYAKIDKQVLSSERLAKWNINYASYLIDVGRYLDALDAYNTAYEVTPFRQTKLKVLLYKANLFATFLDAELQALEIYNKIIKSYPQKREVALYRKGLLLFDMAKYKEAANVLSIYLKKYPRGRFKFQAEVLFERSKRPISHPPPTKLELKRKIPSIRVLLLRRAKIVKIQGRRLKINGKVINKRRLIFKTNSVHSKIYIIESPFPIKVSARRYSKRVRGKIVIRPERLGFMVINVLDIEHYLWGVVPAESYPFWPLETLKAQAVAARTYAYYQVLHRKDWKYDLVDNEGDQAYKGVDWETPKTNKAVNDTKGLIIVKKNRPILAMYTANSGGYTADAGYIFNLNKTYLVAHPDPLSLKGKMSSWRKSFTLKEIEIRLRNIGIPVRGLINIIPKSRGPSGRVVTVEIVSKNLKREYRTRTTLGRALKLPDILFLIRKVENKIIFQGRGWGHGVGYSQWGSAEMGEMGYNFRKILKFYYPSTKLMRLW